MENTLKAISEMWDYFDEKSDWMDMMSSEYDNGEKDTKADYKEKKLEIIEEVIKELEKFKSELVGKKHGKNNNR
jgi:hypothetical protein